MNKIKEYFKIKTYHPNRYTFKKGVKIINTDDGCFVFKKKKNNIKELYKYLNSRNFNYYPKLIDELEDYNIYEYIEEVKTPKEQKAQDLIYLISLLHNKTTYYKEVDLVLFKEIYENIINKLTYLDNYYQDIITMIEKDVYMSPSQYLVARHISLILSVITFCQKEINNWYELIKDKTKTRVVTLHNNLEVDHLLGNEIKYLISWEHSTIGMPIYDFYLFYKKQALELDFSELLKLYESKYPLLEEERKLLFILISIPDKVSFNDSEYENCKRISKTIEYLSKNELLIAPYYQVKEIEKTTNFQK
ncbi:MAG: hypothetical protein ACOXZR_04475 [Bacilli bacterium]|jgi:hypothetical protein